MKKCVILLLAGLLSTGCVSQYVRPRFDPKGVHFSGAADYLLTVPKVRIIVVHGMCTHTAQNWIDDGWDPQIRKALAATISPGPRALGEIHGPVTIQTNHYAIGTKALEVSFILWSNATAALKSTLLYDDGPPKGEFRWRRATLNASYKEALVNDCFSDAVIYAGAYGAVLRSSLEQALCLALDLSYNASTRDCEEPRNRRSEIIPTLFVTESLGSKMTFDALMDLLSRDKTGTLHSRLLFVPQIDMFANQLPLLELAEKTAPAGSMAAEGARGVIGQSTAVQFVDELLKARNAPHLRTELLPNRGAVSIVAFTDPNDLLSYRLRPSDWPQTVNVANVIDSNAGTLFGFLLENPEPAHTGYVDNARVMRLVLCGHGDDGCGRLRKELAH